MIVKFRVLKLSVLCFAWAATAVSQSLLERQVLDTDSAWANAENRHDIAALDRILDDQSVTTSAGSLCLTTTYLDRGDRWVAIAEQMNAPRSKPDLSAAEATLRKLDAEWAQTKSVDAWLGFYADDAIVLPPNDKVAHGKEADRKSVAALLGLPGLQLTWSANRVEVAASGDFACITGAYTMSFNDDAGKRISDACKTLEVWRVQPDGKWKCVADTWNSDLTTSAQ